MMKSYKIFLILMLCLALIPIVSATASFSNYDVEVTPIVEPYGAIDVWDGNVFFPDEKVATHTLEFNTDECLIDCSASGTTTLYRDGQLFDDLTFSKEVKNARITLINGETYEVNIPDYQEICNNITIPANGTNSSYVKEECNNKQIGTHKETKYKDIEYEGEVLKAGNYQWKIEAQKGIRDNIDWIAYSNNVGLTQWAWWNSSWKYKRNISSLTAGSAYSYMNITYQTNMDANFQDLRFTDIAETTQLPYYIESYVPSGSVVLRVFNNYNTSVIMYYGNTSAVPAGSNFTATYGQTNVAYFFDEGTGTAVQNHGGLYNATTKNNPSWKAGKLGQAMNFNGTTQYINISASGAVDETNFDWNFTLAFWFNATVKTTTYRTLARDSGVAGTTTKFQMYTPSGDDGLYGTWNGATGGITIHYTISPARDEKWHFAVFTCNASGVAIYYDGVLRVVGALPATNNGLVNIPTYIGRRNSADSYWIGDIDEVMLINRTLTNAEIVNLNNSFAPAYSLGAEELSGTPLSITTTLISPVNNTNYSTSQVTFSANATAVNGNVTNMTLYIWNGATITNSTLGLTGTFNSSTWVQGGIPDGIKTWNVLSCATNSTGTECAFNTNRTLTIDATKPSVSIVYPTAINYSTNVSGINYTYSDAHIGNCSYSKDGGITNSTPVTAGTNFTGITSTEGTNTWKLYCNDTFGNLNTTQVTFFKDTIFPLIDYDVTNPADNLFINAYNWTISVVPADSNLRNSTFRYYNNVTNYIDVQISLKTINLPDGTYYYNASVCDIANNCNTTTTRTITLDRIKPIVNLFLPTGVYLVSNVSINYSATDTNLNDCWYSINNGTTNVTLDSCGNSTLFLIVGNNTVNLWADDLAGNIADKDTIYAYYFPTVDNCTDNSIELFNLTVYDEDSLAVLDGALDNVTIELDFTFKSLDGMTTWLTYSNVSTLINPSRLCFNSSLGSNQYRLDGVVGYSGLEKFKEYYYFQNYTLSTASSGLNILLYDLNSTIGQTFKITYKDSNFVPVINAILDIQRKYISEGLFRTIERPKTGAGGYTMGHFIVNDAIYNILVYKEGILLATFENVVAACQNPTLQDCLINLNSLGTSTVPDDYSNEDGVTFNMKYNSTTRTVSSTYSVVSGASATVDMNVTLADSLGTTAVCSDSLINSGGTLSCVVPAGFGNATITSILYKDGSKIGLSIIKMPSKPSDIYGGNIVLLAMLIFLTIVGIGATSDSPMVMGITIILGSIVLVALNLIYSPSFIGVGATILWFIVAVVLVLIKGSNRQ